MTTLMYLLLLVLLCINMVYIDTLVINRKQNEINKLRSSITELNIKYNIMSEKNNEINDIMMKKINDINDMNNILTTKVDIMTKKINDVDVIMTNNIYGIDVFMTNKIDIMTETIDDINAVMTSKVNKLTKNVNELVFLNVPQMDIRSFNYKHWQYKLYRAVSELSHNTNNKGHVYPYMYSYINMLLDTGSDINAAYDNGQTALMICSEGFPDYVKLLLSRGANTVIIDNKGKTALMLAVQNYHHHDSLIKKKTQHEIIKLLLDSGANKDIKDDEDKTALDFAISSNNAVAVSLLK